MALFLYFKEENVMNIRNAIAVLIMSLASVSASAGTIIGTGALALLTDNNNLYVQTGIAQNLAMNVDIAGLSSNSISISVAGKLYIADTGLFAKAGLTSNAEEVLLIGMEQSRNNLVYGVEGGVGAVAGSEAVSLFLGIRF